MAILELRHMTKEKASETITGIGIQVPATVNNDAVLLEASAIKHTEITSLSPKAVKLTQSLLNDSGDGAWF